MSNVETLERQVKQLTPAELAEFRSWFLEFEWENWDRQLEKDINSGKLASLAQKAREHHAKGRTTSL